MKVLRSDGKQYIRLAEHLEVVQNLKDSLESRSELETDLYSALKGLAREVDLSGNWMAGDFGWKFACRKAEEAMESYEGRQ